MSTRWTTQQILSIKRTAEPSRFNPKPVGLMCPGSATEAVFTFLVGQHGRGWVKHYQIMAGTRRTKRAVDWALIYLKVTGRIETSQDPKHARYLRYRAAPPDTGPSR